MSLSTEIPTADDADLVWGADAIGNVIGRTARQVDHLLQRVFCRPGSSAVGGSRAVNGCSRPSSATTDDQP
jgi:hypothetical protein